MVKRVLVTGGAGFLGSHLCRRLLEQGNKVFCLDDFSTGKRENIAGCLQQPGFELLCQDVIKPINLPVDEIYNLACPASPLMYQANKIRTVKTNVLGMMNILELARNTKAKVMQASTSEVYGDALRHPQNEDYWGNVNPVGPRSCYDEGKRMAETLCHDYRDQYGVDVRIVRIFNTYGPNMRADDGRVVSNFIISALTGKDITVYGDGSQTRSFCYVDDLIRGFLCMMELSEEWLGPVNLGNPGEYTVLELADKILKKTYSDSKIVFLPLPQDDPKQRCPDITLAQTKLGWKPEINIDEGLTRTIAYFQQLMQQAGLTDSGTSRRDIG